MLAVAFVVDSSAALALEWHHLIPAYIMPMLRRLSETHPAGNKMRVAFITYGTQGKPLVCKNFFSDLHPVMAALREEAKLGIGQTTYGGNMGMAALEGFVAALELFDTLKQAPRILQYPPVQHIIHVAAAAPDGSERPQCNNSPILDSVTWDSLPSELKKRNIHFSSIALRPKLQKFSDLYLTCTSSPAAPWFTVRSQHTVLLAGFATIPQKGVKRPGEPIAVDKTPDAKRTKISPPNTNASPKTTQVSPAPPRVDTPATVPIPSPVRIATPSAPPSTTAPMAPAPNMSPASAPAPPAPGTSPSLVRLPMQRLQQIQNALRATEAPVRALEAAIAEARAKGDTQLAENLMLQWTEKNNVHLKLKQNIHAMLAQQRALYAHAQQMEAAQQGQAAAQNSAAQAQLHVQQGQPRQPMQQGQQVPGLHQGQGGLQGQGQQGQTVQPQTVTPDTGDVQMGGADSSGNNMLPSQSQPTPPLGNAEIPGHMRSLSGGGGGPQRTLPMPVNPGMAPSPMMAQQMQKMIEQKERARPTGAPAKNTSVPVWQGLMTWSGTNPAGEPREVSTFVIANSGTPELCHPESWPTTLTVTIADKPAVTLRELQVWMKRVEPVLCTFAANPRAPNQVNNEMAYKSLVAILIQRNLYFVAAWTLPNGKQSNNVLIFPVANAGLVGAFFPLNGIPDMPQGFAGNPSLIPNPTPNPEAPPPQNMPQPPQTGTASGPQLMMLVNTYLMQNGVNIPQALLIQIVKMPVPARNAMMAKLIRTGLEQRRRAAASGAMGSGNSNAAQGQAGAGRGMPQMGMMQQQMGQQQQQQQQQLDMGGFNPGHFGVGGNAPGMGAGMAGGMGGMGVGANPGMYPDTMGGGGLPRPVSGSGGGAVSFEMMQSFMQRNQEIGGSNAGG